MCNRFERLWARLRGREIAKCNLCGSDQSRLVCKKAGFRVVCCLGCSLVYVNPRLTEAECLKRYSPDYFNNEYLPWMKANLEAVQVHCRAVCGGIVEWGPQAEPFRLLELGCGTGTLLHLAQKERGWDVTGVEFNPVAVAYAHEHYGLQDHVVQGNLYTVDYPDNHFHAVVLADVIEHVLDPMKILTRIHRWLVPGGVLFLSTPNIAGKAFARLGKDWDMIGPEEHVYYFSDHTLPTMLKKCALPCIRMYHVNDDFDAMFAFACKAA